jgi:pimeloyl-ACP methyl ester carboxylesterase
VLKIDVRDQLKKCRVPILYLRGTQDRLVSRRNADEIAAASPLVQVVQLPAPHFVLQTQPAAAAAAVTKFVMALPPNPPPEGPAPGV